MNKAWLLLFLLPLLFLTSCADKDEAYPSLLEPIFTPKRDFYLLIEHHTDIESKDQDLYLNVVGKELCGALKLNGHVFYRDSYTYDLISKYYTVNFDAQQNDWLILDENEQNLSYEIMIPDHPISGTIKVPSQMNVSFPDFNPLQNYSVDWTIPEAPGFFSYSFLVSDWGNSVSSSGSLDDKVRSYTCNKEIWKDFSAYRRWSAELASNNYKYEHKGMVWVMRSEKKSTYFDNYSVPHIPFAPFKQFMRGELVLPTQK